MINLELFPFRKRLSGIECAICRSSGKTGFQIKQLGRSFGMVCRDCLEGFTGEDLEFMHNMFTAFGGHFGSLGTSKRENFGWLEEIASSYRKDGKAASCVENDVKTLHRSFLQGIPIPQLIGSLRVLLE